MAADGGSNDKGETKKRLKLMPEVLPAPKKAQGTGSARQRTMKTMERLIAVSAASALIAGAEVTGGCGYGVVDPLPPPSQCPNVASSIAAKATWKLDNGQFVIILELGVPGKTDASYVDSDPTISYGGKLVSRTLNQGALTITITPDAGVQNVGIYVPISCAEGNAHVMITMDTSKAPADGVEIPLNKYDEF
jgi:hypothetical protein